MTPYDLLVWLLGGSAVTGLSYLGWRRFVDPILGWFFP